MIKLRRNIVKVCRRTGSFWINVANRNVRTLIVYLVYMFTSVQPVFVVVKAIPLYELFKIKSKGAL